jgi:hypothetical protein
VLAGFSVNCFVRLQLQTELTFTILIAAGGVA